MLAKAAVRPTEATLSTCAVEKFVSTFLSPLNLSRTSSISPLIKKEVPPKLATLKR